MKIKKEQTLKVNLKETDAHKFKSAIKKIAEQQEKVGFKSSILNEDESNLIIELNKKIN